MKKYEQFGAFLAQSRRDSIEMTFEQVERAIGQKLPPSAFAHRPWWSNNPSNNALTQQWLNAGYRTEQVDMSKHRLVFRRERAGTGAARAPTRANGIADLFGKLKGMFRLAPGTDLTQPADPGLGEYIEKAYGPRSPNRGRR